MNAQRDALIDTTHLKLGRLELLLMDVPSLSWCFPFYTFRLWHTTAALLLEKVWKVGNILF